MKCSQIDPTDSPRSNMFMISPLWASKKNNLDSEPLGRPNRFPVLFHLFQGVFCTYGNQTVINLVYLLEDINHQLAIHPVIEYITVVYTIDRHVLLHANGKYPHQLI